MRDRASDQNVAGAVHINNQDRSSGQPLSSNCCHSLATRSSLHTAMTHHLVEVFSRTRSAWFVASVVSSTNDGSITVHFVDLDDTVKQKNLPRHVRRPCGIETSSRIPDCGASIASRAGFIHAWRFRLQVCHGGRCMDMVSRRSHQGTGDDAGASTSTRPETRRLASVSCDNRGLQQP